MVQHDDGRAAKLTALRAWLRERGSVLIGYSGGVDSTFLLRVAAEELAERALAVTVRSQVCPDWEYRQAADLAAAMGARHEFIDVDVLADPAVAANPPDRCYHCKLGIFGRLKALAAERGLAVVCDGTNVDDGGDYRPGHRAIVELGVASPLAECGLRKADIRALSRDLGLPTWDKPAYACLASRFPYGEQLTADGLRMVGQAEEALRRYGFGQLRVRHHGSVARLEVLPAEFATALASAEAIVRDLTACGFRYVALDLRGYRTGSLNEGLPGRRGE